MSSFAYSSDSNNYSSYSNSSPRRFNGLEFLVILFSVLAIIIAGLIGFWNQDAVNRDKQRAYDIAQVVLPALIDFYKNSSTVENKRFYPIAQCSGNLNEVDYELTLRQHLVGKLVEIEPHTYINNKDFPRDPFGQYNSSLSGRRTPFRCPERLNNLNALKANTNLPIYPDFSSCNFSSRAKIVKCYLYTTSSSGDSFRLGYFSESKNCFVVYSRFRNQNMQNSLECNF